MKMIKLKIISVTFTGKILTLTGDTSFLPKKKGVKAFPFPFPLSFLHFSREKVDSSPLVCNKRLLFSLVFRLS